MNDPELVQWVKIMVAGNTVVNIVGAVKSLCQALPSFVHQASIIMGPYCTPQVHRGLP